MEQEKWTDLNIPGLDFKYQVSNMGRVKRLSYDVVVKRGEQEYIAHKKERMLKVQNQKYQVVQLLFDGIQKPFYVHRLVATAFIPNPDNLPEVNHINENKYDNSCKNLEWCTHEYNMRYSARLRTLKGGMNEEERKAHNKAVRKKWREEHKEHVKAWEKEYRIKNKERRREWQRKYREKNKELLSAKRKEY